MAASLKISWLQLYSLLDIKMPAYKYITQMGHLKVVHYHNGDNYHIFIDNDYKGRIVKLKTHWVADVGDTLVAE